MQSGSYSFDAFRANRAVHVGHRLGEMSYRFDSLGVIAERSREQKNDFDLLIEMVPDQAEYHMSAPGKRMRITSHHIAYVWATNIEY